VIRLLSGEIYRLLRKRSAYIFFGAVAAGYFFVAFIRSGGFGAGSVVNDAYNFFMFLPPVAGGFWFTAVYTDDLNSKNLTALVGYGCGKTRIIAAKFILAAIANAAVVFTAPLYHIAVYTLFGQAASPGETAIVYAAATKYFLMITAYSSAAAIAVYGTQRATFAVVTYILLAFNVIGGLAAAAAGSFAPNVSKYLASGITDKVTAKILSGVFPDRPLAEYAAYIIITAALSAFAFHKKETEF